MYIVSCSHNNICRQGLLQPYLESVAAICKVCCSNTYSLLQPKRLRVLSFVCKYWFLLQQTFYMAATDSIYGCNRFNQPKHLQQTLLATSIYDCNRPLIWLQQTWQHVAAKAPACAQLCPPVLAVLVMQRVVTSVAAILRVCCSLKYCSQVESVAAVFRVCCSHLQRLLQPYIESVAAMCRVCCSHIYNTSIYSASSTFSCCAVMLMHHVVESVAAIYRICCSHR